MNKRHYEHTLPNIRGSLSNTYPYLRPLPLPERAAKIEKPFYPVKKENRMTV